MPSVPGAVGIARNRDATRLQISTAPGYPMSSYSYRDERSVLGAMISSLAAPVRLTISMDSLDTAHFLRRDYLLEEAPT